MATKLLMLLNAPYPADIRVKKESDALIAAGMEVHLLCLRKNDQAREEVFEGINVHRIDAGKNNYQLAFWDVVMSINFIHPKFKAAAKKILEQENISTIHVHDLPLAGTALSLKKSTNLKVVLDMHENYPEALRTWFAWKKNPIVRIKNALFMNPERWTAFERRACEDCDQIIAVVDEMKTRVETEYNVDSSKITVITNTEDKGFLNQKIDSLVYESLAGQFIITYSGGIGPHRGVDVAIRGMKFLESHPRIQLAIVGFGSPAVMNSLKHLVEELKLTNVHFFGYQPFSKFYSYMSLADVNVIPHQSNGHTNNTVPHKLFQGMMAARPLLVSSSPPLKRLVTHYACGVVFEAGDPQSFADQVTLLYHDADLCNKLGKQGKKAALEGDANWEHTQKELINLYRTI